MASKKNTEKKTSPRCSEEILTKQENRVRKARAEQRLRIQGINERIASLEKQYEDTLARLESAKESGDMTQAASLNSLATGIKNMIKETHAELADALTKDKRGCFISIEEAKEIEAETQAAMTAQESISRTKIVRLEKEILAEINHLELFVGRANAVMGAIRGPLMVSGRIVGGFDSPRVVDWALAPFRDYAKYQEVTGEVSPYMGPGSPAYGAMQARILAKNLGGKAKMPSTWMPFSGYLTKE